MTIRKAKRRDAAELAILVDIASHGFASWLWSGAVLLGKAQTALERGRSRMRDDDSVGGWTDATLAEIDGEVAGVVIGHKLDSSINDEVVPHPALEPLLTLQKRVVGSWFIDSLGVYQHHRGQGIGRRLLDHEMKRAKMGPISLITESDNDVALNLYTSSGFAEMARSENIPHSEGGKRYDWVLLTHSSH